MNEHPYQWFSLLPPVVAIALAMLTRRIVASLITGVFIGSVVLTWDFGQGAMGFRPLAAVTQAATEQLWPALVNPDKLSVFAFTMLMGAMVGVISRSGGMRGLVDCVTPLARTRRRGQFAAWLLGLFVFFDDYANTMLLGHTLRPLTDRLRISREKLAYLVDSTAAPVSGMALISTWVAGEIGYVADGLAKLPAGLDWNTKSAAVELFVASIPFRFYVIWALLFVPMVALLGRDFGAMLKAERRALRGKVSDDSASGGLEAPDSADDEYESGDETPARWFNAVLPILVTVAAITGLMYQSGYSSVIAAADPDQSPTLQNIFGNSDSYGSLLWGSMIGLVSALLLVGAQRLLSWPQMVAASLRGASTMAPALLILWTASALSIMTGNEGNASDSGAEATRAAIASAFQEAGLPTPAKYQPSEEPYPYAAYRLYTGEFLGARFLDSIAAWILPTVVFLLAAGVAFSTGTSWGTMGVLMPLVVDFAYRKLSSGADVEMSPQDPIFLACIGSVLAGAIFGDHCSPISDTTVLSSQSCRCHHAAHVETQMPYALLVAFVAVTCGTLPIGLGAPVYLFLPLGAAALFLLLLLLGRTAEQDA